jgi:excisionase family DNA binding protein
LARVSFRQITATFFRKVSRADEKTKTVYKVKSSKARKARNKATNRFAPFDTNQQKHIPTTKTTKPSREQLRGFRIYDKNSGMNKKEAAEYLGISARQVENYAKKNELSVRYERGKTGDVAVYDNDELRRLKAKLDNQRTPRPSIVTETGESHEIVRASDSRLSDVPKIFELIKVLSDNKKADTIVAISHKPLLKLDEAARLTGLSRDILRTAIDTKELTAKLIGRAFRIKRADLDEYIKNL